MHYKIIYSVIYSLLIPFWDIFDFTPTLKSAMARIYVEIDVLNSSDVIKKKKGVFIGAMASLFMHEGDLKAKIEQVICTEIVNSLRTELNRKLTEEGVTAKLHIEVER